MAEVSIPHFDLPFRFAPNKHARVCQQDTETDVTNCVHAALRTTRGTRYYISTFGITDPTFQISPVDINTIEAEVAENEPRARMILDQTVDIIRDFITVQVGVDIVV